MNPLWIVRTGRLVLRPVAWGDVPDLIALKADPRIYAVMLGGVRGPAQVMAELAEDTAFWGAHGVGMWAVRDADAAPLAGLVGLHRRPDGRGLGLRFAFHAEAQGRGYAREAAGAALRFAHERAGVRRVVAVVRQSNIGSRQVLGGIGMVAVATFDRDGHRMILYESRRTER